jgi:hypothetical protein
MQRIVELIIGRLLTDEQFRTEFLNDPARTLDEAGARGLELTRTEIAALIATDRTLWMRAADLLDSRLQKASLLNKPDSSKESEPHV